MNEKVNEMVDLLFRDTVPSAEVQALHEEVLNNCQDRYADLIRSGLREEEALAAVMESLKGMEEVLREYPRKDAEDGAAEPESAESAEPEKKDEPTLLCFDPEQIRAIEGQLNSCDVEVELSEEGFQMEKIGETKVELKPDGTLLFTQESAADHIFKGISWDTSLSSFASFGEAMTQLGQNVSKAVMRGLGMDGEVNRIHIRMPANVHPEVRIRTTDGNIRWTDALPGEILSLKTTSGDVWVRMDEACLVPEAKIATVSGDVDAEMSAEKITVSTISGDITWAGSAENLEFSSTSGDIEAVGTAKEVTVNTTSGDLELELRDEGPAHVKANTVSGNLSLRLPYSVRTVSTRLKTVSGDTRLRGLEEDENAPIRVEAGTVSGDLRISN